MSAIAPKATELARRNKPPLCAISDHMQRSNSLLDHLVSEREQLVWNRETKCLGRGQIDGEIELDWLLDRDVRRALSRAESCRRIRRRGGTGPVCLLHRAS